MQKRNLLPLFLLFACAASFAQTASSGLVLGFSAAAEVHLTSMTSNARPAPQRNIAGRAWRIVAVTHDGREAWSRDFPAPRR